MQETAHMNATEAAVKADSQCESTVLWASIRQGIDPWALFEVLFASNIKRKNNEPVKAFGKVKLSALSAPGDTQTPCATGV